MWLRVILSGTEVSLRWGNNHGVFEEYNVGQGMLTAACLGIRDRLEALVLVAAADTGMRAKALRELARSGAKLHYVLFEMNEIRKAGTDVKEWMAEEFAGGDHDLRITGDPQIHVPWSLLFEGKVDAIPPDADSLELFDGFWGQKYILSSTTSGYKQPRSKLERNCGNSKLLSLMHEDEAFTAYKGFSGDMQQEYKDLMAYPVGVAHDLAECRKLIDKAVPNDTIFHFFGHQCDGMLDLGDGETIDVFEFRELLDKLTEQKDGSKSYGLVILNACATANGKLDYSFTYATDRSGLCGAIGTEAVVPRDFAARFALQFLTRMLGQGKSVGETMSELRHEPALWPLSLVYGCYAQPDYRISSRPRLNA